MLTLLIVIFIIAYAAIALEHPIKINKSASALLGAGLLWTFYAVMTDEPDANGYSGRPSMLFKRNDRICLLFACSKSKNRQCPPKVN